MSQSKRGRADTASEPSLLNSYQKINSQLTGDKMDKISNKLNSTIKKEENESKIKQLKSL
jgi:hypothetical protein